MINKFQNERILDFLNHLFQLNVGDYIPIDGFRVVKTDSSSFRLEVSNSMKDEIFSMIQKTQSLDSNIISEDNSNKIDFNSNDTINYKSNVNTDFENSKENIKMRKSTDTINQHNMTILDDMSSSNITNLDERDLEEDDDLDKT